MKTNTLRDGTIEKDLKQIDFRRLSLRERYTFLVILAKLELSNPLSADDTYRDGIYKIMSYADCIYNCKGGDDE